MKLLCLFIIICIASLQAAGQATFQFKGQVLHQKAGAQKNLSLIIDNKYSVETNDNGVFVVALPNAQTAVSVSLREPKYNILYPAGGIVYVPKSLSHVPQIIIGNAPGEEYTKQYVSLYKLIKSKPASYPQLAGLKTELDSLRGLLIRLHTTDQELEALQQQQDGRDDYYPEISADITEYVTQAIDLTNQFKYVADFAFENKVATARLEAAILQYAPAFEKLNRQHKNYEKRIGSFWEKDSLQSAFRSMTSLALDSVHKQYLFAMLPTIRQINEYFTAKRKNEELKRSIRQQIAAMVEGVNPLLQRLQRESAAILEALKDY